MNRSLNEDFDWQRCPEAARRVEKRIDEIVSEVRFASCLRQRMRDETGTRFIDWVDHICLPFNDPLSEMVEELGYFRAEHDAAQEVWLHPGAMVPAIRLREQPDSGVWLKVDSVSDFLRAHDLDDVALTGEAAAPVQAGEFFFGGRGDRRYNWEGRLDEITIEGKAEEGIRHED